MAEAGIYAVVLPELSDSKIKELVKEEIAGTFSLLKRTAATIIESAPIILIENATEQEAHFLQRHFRKITGANLDVHIRSELDGTLPHLSWQKHPAVLRELLSRASAVEDSTDAFGEVEFVESNIGVRKMVFDTKVETKAPTSVQETAPKYQNTAAKPAVKKRVIPDFMKKQDDSSDAFSYNVFLCGVSNDAKIQCAMELICELKGISELEATELMSRTVVPVAKNLTKVQSEEIQKMFHDSRLNVRIMKKQK